MAITREQFIRGFNALQASFDRPRAMNQAAKKAGIEDYEHGLDPVAFELQRQLEERCDDVDDGDWGSSGSAISYGLHEGHIVTPGAGRESFRMNTAEAVWRWWEETKTGPFTVKDGHVLVPRTPTDAMLQGACRTHKPGVAMANHRGECPAFERRRRAWAQMVAAAEAGARA